MKHIKQFKNNYFFKKRKKEYSEVEQMCVHINKSYRKSVKRSKRSGRGLGRCPGWVLGTQVITNTHDQWHVLNVPIRANSHGP